MKKLLPLSLVLLLAACGQEGFNQKESVTTTSLDTSFNGLPPEGSGAAPGAPAGGNGNGAEAGAAPLDDPSRKIIKTADLRCRVADLYAATTGIERVVRGVGGQVASSRMENREGSRHELRQGADSLRIVQVYTPVASLTLRVPVAQLDTVLAVVGAQAAFINERRLQLDDVTLRYLSTRLKADAMRSVDAASRAGALARKSGDAIAADAYRDQRNDSYIDRRIENLSLADQVAYATLTVALYQPDQIAQQLVPDVPRMLEPGLGQRVGGALAAGWGVLQQVLVVLLSVWPLLLLAGAGWWAYRRWRPFSGTMRKG